MNDLLSWITSEILYNQSRNEKFFGAREFSWNMNTLTNVSCTNTKERLRRERFWCFFSKILSKLHLTHRCSKTGHVFPKSRTFSKKSRGAPAPSPPTIPTPYSPRPPPSPPASCASDNI